MSFVTFHHPDFCPQVARRKAGDELMMLLGGWGTAWLTGGRSLLWSDTFPSRQAYWSAVSRLRRKGLVVSSRGLDAPRLELTDLGQDQIPEYFRPERHWKRAWKGIWYLLIYDIPESERSYRDVLRAFLRRLRMGCLQKSAWITPDDIRADYDDLAEAAAVKPYSHLMETRSVLGRSAQDIVWGAWPMDRLEQLQAHYGSVARQNLAIVNRGDLSREALVTLATEEVGAYCRAMQNDPLLPHNLLPRSYRGREVYGLHVELTQAMARAARAA